MSVTDIQIVDGQMVFTDTALVLITGAEAISQRLSNRLLLYLGGWYLKPESGVDWPDILNDKPVREDRVAEVLKSALKNEAGVKRVTKLEVTFNNGTRELTVTFEADTDLGLVTGEVSI